MQLVRNKMDLHYRNLRSVNLGHRIYGQEAIEERWIPLLDKETRELWLQEPNDLSLKLCDRLMILNHRVDVSRAREKIGPRVRERTVPFANPPPMPRISVMSCTVSLSLLLPNPARICWKEWPGTRICQVEWVLW